MSRRRSGCPINLTLETFGDRWSLIVLRDLMFGPNRTFRSLLANSIEGIASNILADRLDRLTDHGLLSRSGDPLHKQRIVYSLTDRAIDLVPLMVAMGSWGLRHALPSAELAVRAQILEDGGPALWSAFMDEAVILRVVDKFLLVLETQLAEKKVDVTFTDKLRKHLAKKGFDPLMGARPMQRLIQDTIRRALADELLFGRLTDGGRLTVDIELKTDEKGVETPEVLLDIQPIKKEGKAKPEAEEATAG